MKQTITIEQLNELSQKGKKRLETWIKSKLSLPISGSAYIGPLSSPYQTCYFMTIGQLIEFLPQEVLDRELAPDMCGECEGFIDKNEVCDTLWEAVKEILEEDDK